MMTDKKGPGKDESISKRGGYTSSEGEMTMPVVPDGPAPGAGDVATPVVDTQEGLSGDD
jgi:hypothetical protein